MSRYEALYQCHLTGQMDDRELNDLMTGDAVFAVFVRRKVAARLTKGKK